MLTLSDFTNSSLEFGAKPRNRLQYKNAQKISVENALDNVTQDTCCLDTTEMVLKVKKVTLNRVEYHEKTIHCIGWRKQ